MTGRVIDCRRRLSRPAVSLASPEAGPAPSTAAQRHRRGLLLAGLTGLVLVPIAGAAEPPQGWTVGLVMAVTLLVLGAVFGRRVRWGWLSVLTATAAIVTPRGQLALIGPALFVATGLCLVLWLANQEPARPAPGHPRSGSPEREAQLAMGLAGEREVGELLARELPEAFVVINGLKLPRGAGDIDHLVVGPTGVFLLETKTMAGRIVCHPDGTWQRTRLGRGGAVYPAYIGDPAAQVQRNIFAVRNALRGRAPRLFRRAPVWVEGLVVFAHPRTELEAEHSRVPAVRLEQVTAQICGHVPQRSLAPDEVETVVDALLIEGNQRVQPRPSDARSAQALIEVALALPLVLTLLFGTVGLSRVIQAQTAVIAVAHEAARAGALGSTPQDAITRLRQRAELVAAGLGLDSAAIGLDWDVSTFSSPRGQVVASVQYSVRLDDLPLAGWVPAAHVRAEHVEWVDPFRSGMSRLPAETP